MGNIPGLPKFSFERCLDKILEGEIEGPVAGWDMKAETMHQWLIYSGSGSPKLFPAAKEDVDEKLGSDNYENRFAAYNSILACLGRAHDEAMPMKRSLKTPCQFAARRDFTTSLQEFLGSEN